MFEYVWFILYLLAHSWTLYSILTPTQSISPACFHLHESFTIILYLHSAYFRSVMTVNVFPPSPFLALVNHLLGHYKFFTFRSRSDAENTTSRFIFLDIGGRVGHTCSVGPCEPLQVHLLLAIVGQTTWFNRDWSNGFQLTCHFFQVFWLIHAIFIVKYYIL